MKPQLHLEPPGGARSILLHSCCAPCSTAIVECMLENGLRPTLFYYNPNIFPREEYDIRKAEATRFARANGLDIVDADYDHTRWLQQVSGLEHEPERGARCQECFVCRLMATAAYASRHGFVTFATTLASSRWKSMEQVDRAGRVAQEAFPGTVYWSHNWRRGGLQERRNELLRQYAFYNQRYCGCEFSLQARLRHEEERGR